MISTFLILTLTIPLFAQSPEPVRPFPPYRIVAPYAKADFPSKPARLCLLNAPRTCYKLDSIRDGSFTKGEVVNFGRAPRAERHELSDGGSLVLFMASSGGGSGTTFRLALLRYSTTGSLDDLLPRTLVDNQSDYALWEEPNLSSMPILLTADFLWGAMEAHYGDHRYTVRAYRYDEPSAKYEPVLRYVTKHKYPSADIFDGARRYPVLRHERERIVSELESKIPTL